MNFLFGQLRKKMGCMYRLSAVLGHRQRSKRVKDQAWSSHISHVDLCCLNYPYVSPWFCNACSHKRISLHVEHFHLINSACATLVGWHDVVMYATHPVYQTYNYIFTVSVSWKDLSAKTCVAGAISVLILLLQRPRKKRQFLTASLRRIKMQSCCRYCD